MKFKLRGHRIMLDKPEKKEKENKLDLILSESDEKDIEKDAMVEWTHLNVFAVGTEVTDISVGDKVYVRTGALQSSEIVDVGGDIKMLVLVHDVVMIWE